MAILPTVTMIGIGFGSLLSGAVFAEMSARAVIDLDTSLSTTRPVLPDPSTVASPR